MSLGELPALLARLGADRVHHSGTTLADHLLDTWRVLVSWECPASTCVAGVLHDVYGCLLPLTARSREVVRAAAGIEVETIVHRLATVPASGVHEPVGRPAPVAAGAIAVDVAGALEEMLRIDVEPAVFERDAALFSKSLHVLPAAAQRVVREVWPIVPA